MDKKNGTNGKYGFDQVLEVFRFCVEVKYLAEMSVGLLIWCRKGMKCIVLERSEVLRYEGGAIGIMTNGWLALDQLGVASILREAAYPLLG